MKLFLIVLFVIPLVGYSQVDSLTAQTVSIINAQHKMEGIYKTFEEFRRNKPFYTDSFEVLPFGRGDQVMINTWNDELVYRNEDGKTKQQGAQRFFGFCRSDTIFVSTIFWHHGFTCRSFCPIIELGNLSLVRFYKKIGIPVDDSTTMIPAMPIAKVLSPHIYLDDVPFEKFYVLDFMTGEFISVNTFFLKTKFELWDKELFNEYRKRKDKNDLSTQLEFVRKFNERNPIRF